MADSSKIRVGIVGLSPQRGFASIAHIPALHALSDFEIAAVCTARQESAEVAARHFGIPLAFSNAEDLARHPDVDLVTVTVKVPDHYRPVMAAIDAGKHVYCEWPLGRNTAEAQQMLDAAERKSVRHAVGLQGQWSPTIDYVRDLVTDGYVGKVLTATLIGCAPNWAATLDRAYQADFANGANLMTITGGHQIDALCHCLGEFRELSAFAVSQRDRIVTDDQGEVALTSPDQLAVSGILQNGAVVSFQIRGGMTRGTEFLFEIHGTEGDLAVASTTGGSMQRQELSLHGAQGKGTKLAELPIPAKYRYVPENTPANSPYNGPVPDADRYTEPILTYPMRAVTEFLRNPHARIRVPPVVAYLNTALTGRRQPTAALPAVVNGSKSTTRTGTCPTKASPAESSYGASRPLPCVPASVR